MYESVYEHSDSFEEWLSVGTEIYGGKFGGGEIGIGSAEAEVGCAEKVMLNN